MIYEETDFFFSSEAVKDLDLGDIMHRENNKSNLDCCGSSHVKELFSPKLCMKSAFY